MLPHVLPVGFACYECPWLPPPHCTDKQKALYAKYWPGGVHQPRLEVHLEFLAPLGAFDYRRIFMVCWDSERGCYSVAAGGSSEPEHALGPHAFCGDKLSPGTRNSARLPPGCRRAQTRPCSHLLPGCCSCTRGHWFHQIINDSPQKASTPRMCLLQLKNSNQLHCYSRCVRSVWKHFETEDLSWVSALLHRAPERHLQMQDTSQHSVLLQASAGSA